MDDMENYLTGIDEVDNKSEKFLNEI